MHARRSPTILNLETGWRSEDNPERREVIKKKMWPLRAKMKTDIKEQMVHVLRHLREGGWGKKALQEAMSDMTQLRINATTVIMNEEVVAIHARQCYSDLFETTQHLEAPEEREREYRLQALIERDVTDENFDGCVAATSAETGLSACPKRKTCAATDGVVTEMWQAADRGNSEVRMMIAWAFYRKLQNSAPIEPQYKPPDPSLPPHTRTQLGQRSDRRQPTRRTHLRQQRNDDDNRRATPAATATATTSTTAPTRPRGCRA